MRPPVGGGEDQRPLAIGPAHGRDPGLFAQKAVPPIGGDGEPGANLSVGAEPGQHLRRAGDDAGNTLAEQQPHIRKRGEPVHQRRPRRDIGDVVAEGPVLDLLRREIRRGTGRPFAPAGIDDPHGGQRGGASRHGFPGPGAAEGLDRRMQKCRGALVRAGAGRCGVRQHHVVAIGAEPRRRAEPGNAAAGDQDIGLQAFHGPEPRPVLRRPQARRPWKNCRRRVTASASAMPP